MDQLPDLPDLPPPPDLGESWQNLGPPPDDSHTRPKPVVEEKPLVDPPTDLTDLPSFIASLPLVDAHAHNLIDHANTASVTDFRRCFSEANASSGVAYVPQTALYKRSVRELCKLHGVSPPNEENLVAHRQQYELASFSTAYLQAANFDEIMLDSAYSEGNVLPLDKHPDIMGTVHINKILRIEQTAEDLFKKLIDQEVDLAEFNQLLETAFELEVDKGEGLPLRVNAFKSIIGYHTDLNIPPKMKERQVSQCFHSIRGKLKRASAAEASQFKLHDKLLLHHLLHLACDSARKLQIAIQIHCGSADPNQLRPFLDSQAASGVNFVLTNVTTPYHREAARLAGVYANLYIDFGQSVPGVSVEGLARVLGEMMELAPASKLIWSSDAQLLPDLFFLGAMWGRQAVSIVFGEALQNGDLDLTEACLFAYQILRGNAQRVYHLDAAIQREGQVRPYFLQSIPSADLDPELDEGGLGGLACQYLHEHRGGVVDEPQKKESANLPLAELDVVRGETLDKLGGSDKDKWQKRYFRVEQEADGLSYLVYAESIESMQGAPVESKIKSTTSAFFGGPKGKNKKGDIELTKGKIKLEGATVRLLGNRECQSMGFQWSVVPSDASKTYIMECKARARAEDWVNQLTQYGASRSEILDRSPSLKGSKREAYVMKQPTKPTPDGWRCRYAVLDPRDKLVHYYKNYDTAKTGQHAGVILLEHVISVEVQEGYVLGREFAFIFNMTGSREKFYFAAKDEEDRQAWVNDIQSLMKR